MKSVMIVIGCISLLIGILGIFIPLLPTTPFVLLSAWLFVRSSPRLHTWLTENRYLGEYVRNYQNNKALPLRMKATSIVLMWATILYAIFFVVEGRLWLQILLFLIALAVSLHILTLRTTKRGEKN